MNKFSITLIIASVLSLFGAEALMAQEYKVGVCDWMILKRQKLGEFDLARQLGSDGVEMDMGGLGKREMFDNKMRDDKEAAHFKSVADSLGIEIGAIAMSGFYAQDLTKRDNYMALVEDCFDTMGKMGDVKVAFLPLGGCGNDWPKDKAKRAIIVKRLHAIGKNLVASMLEGCGFEVVNIGIDVSAECSPHHHNGLHERSYRCIRSCWYPRPGKGNGRWCSCHPRLCRRDWS